MGCVLIKELFSIPLPVPGADQQAVEEYYNYLLPSDWSENSPDLTALKATLAQFLSDGYTELSAGGNDVIAMYR